VSEVHDPIQERLIAARRVQILDAATRVFAEKGFHRATVRHIARTENRRRHDLQLFRQ
jgi:AcrR family transcriptional regulator